jgi:hypothetical protein
MSGYGMIFADQSVPMNCGGGDLKDEADSPIPAQFDIINHW